MRVRPLSESEAIRTFSRKKASTSQEPGLPGNARRVALPLAENANPTTTDRRDSLLWLAARLHGRSPPLACTVPSSESVLLSIVVPVVLSPDTEQSSRRTSGRKSTGQCGRATLLRPDRGYEPAFSPLICVVRWAETPRRLFLFPPPGHPTRSRYIARWEG